MIACLALLGLFGFVLLRGLRRTELVADRFALLAATGLIALSALQSMVNLGVNLSLLPANGMTLPFISYGGSSLCALALGMGLFLALTRRRPERRGARCEPAGGDRGRRHGRAYVSGAGLAAELRARGRPVVARVRCPGRPLLDAASLEHHLIQAASPDRALRRTAARARAARRSGSVRVCAFSADVRPAAVAAFGGYAAAPVGLAAALLRVPVLVHEQNAVLGRANRLIVRRAARLALRFAPTRGAETACRGRRRWSPATRCARRSRHCAHGHTSAGAGAADARCWWSAAARARACSATWCRRRSPG